MSGARIEVRLDADPALRGLSAILATLRQPARVMRDIGEALLLSTDQRFRAQVGPDGKPWKQLSDVTLLRRIASRKGTLSKKRTATGGQTLTKKGMKVLAGAKILRDSGMLQDTIRYQLAAGGLAVEIGTDRVYGATHQFGAKMGQFGRYSQLWRRKAYAPSDFRHHAGTKKGFPIPWGDIPARPFLGLSAQDRAQIIDIIRRHIGSGS